MEEEERGGGGGGKNEDSIGIIGVSSSKAPWNIRLRPGLRDFRGIVGIGDENCFGGVPGCSGNSNEEASETR